MKTVLTGGLVVDVLKDVVTAADILIDGEYIAAVERPGAFAALSADPAVTTVDCTGRILCPGFIDGHIHIESTLMLPAQLSLVCAAHGTTTIVADPHEIANVCGAAGIRYMLDASAGLPVDVLFALPSCVPAGPFDEAGAELHAADLRPFYAEDRVVALGEVMNYPGVLAGDADLLEKIADARAAGRVVNGHAPGLLGDDLVRYCAAGVNDDHECSTFEEARQRIEAGMWVMIRQGSAARNLEALMPLFAPEYNRRCLLVTDDKHADDLLEDGHIDAIIRRAAELGANPLTAIRMATVQAAQCFNLTDRGVLAPGYLADIAMLDGQNALKVCACWHRGKASYVAGQKNAVLPPQPADDRVRNSFRLPLLTPEDFLMDPGEAVVRRAHVIKVFPGQLLTGNTLLDLDFSSSNGTDASRDVAKIAVIERHKGTGHRGLGYITGLGLVRGAVASSVSHDSHNLIVVGTSEEDMAAAANAVITCGGGRAAVQDGRVLALQRLPIAGLMSDLGPEQVAAESAALDRAIAQVGCASGVDPIMTMAFTSLTVIPHVKMTTFGPFDVDRQQVIPLFE